MDFVYEAKQWHCVHCGAAVHVASTAAARVKCPSCGRLFTTPFDDGHSVSTHAQPELARPQASSHGISAVQSKPQSELLARLGARPGEEVSPPCPWRRFLACKMEWMAFGTPAAVVVAVAYIDAGGDPDMPGWIYGSGLVALVVWLFIEAVLLSAVGTTPIKCLFGMRVVTASGQRPTLRQAIKRSAIKWVEGLGFGLPLVSLITLWISYRTLTHLGSTAWDTKCDLWVLHKRIGALRMLGILVVGILVVGTAFVLPYLDL